MTETIDAVRALIERRLQEILKEEWHLERAVKELRPPGKGRRSTKTPAPRPGLASTQKGNRHARRRTQGPTGKVPPKSHEPAKAGNNKRHDTRGADEHPKKTNRPTKTTARKPGAATETRSNRPPTKTPAPVRTRRTSTTGAPRPTRPGKLTTTAKAPTKSVTRQPGRPDRKT